MMSTYKHKDTLISIQCLRGIAILLVVYIHAVGFYPGRDGTILGSFASFGGSGVDIFFVISGFLMFYITIERDKIDSHEFLRRRIHRIIPTYWFWTIIFFILMSTLVPDGKWQASYTHLIRSLLFIPGWNPNGGFQPVLNVGWTLNYEMLFYFAYYLTFRLQFLEKFLLLFLVLTAVIYAGIYSPIILEFLLGGLIYYVYIKFIKVTKARSVYFICAVAGLLLNYIFAEQAYHGHGWIRFVIWGTGSSLVLLGTLASENLFRKSNQATRFLQIIGDSSYSIYLTHWFWGYIIYKILGRFNLLVSVQIMITIVIMLLSGIILYFVIESNILSATRFIIPSNSQKPEHGLSLAQN